MSFFSTTHNTTATNKQGPIAPTRLQPKRQNPHTAVRLQMKAGGYDIIPLREGKKGGEGWPHQPNDEASIRKWGGVGTGIRTYRNDPFILDLDIGIQAVVDDVLAAYTERWPAFMHGCLRRHSGASKIALIGRGNIATRSRRTKRYFTGPEDDSKGNLVEFFGRNDKRLMAVEGAHSEGRSYGYHGAAIWDRPLDTLPWFQNEGTTATRYLDYVVPEEHEALSCPA
jgi:hypothetical protein